MPEGLTKDLIALLLYLLPGFITAWVLHGLTAFPKPSRFEQTVQALIFTVFVQGGLVGIRQGLLFSSRWLRLGTWNSDVSLVWSCVVAVGLGLFLAWCSNNDIVHRLLRRLGVTRETSYPSEWFSTFARRNTWVVLHLKGDRRLYGWPEEWPSSPKDGHFSIQEAEWLGDKNERTPLSRVWSILIPVSDVEMVEFMGYAEQSVVTETLEVDHGQGT